MPSKTFKRKNLKSKKTKRNSKRSSRSRKMLSKIKKMKGGEYVPADFNKLKIYLNAHLSVFNLDDAGSKEFYKRELNEKHMHNREEIISFDGIPLYRFFLKKDDNGYDNIYGQSSDNNHSFTNRFEYEMFPPPSPMSPSNSVPNIGVHRSFGTSPYHYHNNNTIDIEDPEIVN